MKPKENVQLKPFTFFKIGGPAKYFVEAKNNKELQEALKWAKEKKENIFMLGAGSNVLISDKGFDGLVIKNNAKNLEVGLPTGSPTSLIAETGASLAQVVNKSLQAGLVGFEWAIGIPGTIGGAVVGNAGCFGGEMKDAIERVRVLRIANRESRIAGDKHFAICDLLNSQCEFNYRDSIFKRRPDLIILSAKLKLKKGNVQEARAKMQEIVKKRSDGQDIGVKCAGCMFKNVAWSKKGIDKKELIKKHPELKKFSSQEFIPAGFLIDYLGLKGRQIGDMKVSERHANYFVNKGRATAEEVIMLMGLVKEYVHRHYGIFLENEIRLIGF